MNLFVAISAVICLIDTGGSITRIGEYPWMGSVEYKKKDQLTLLCGAVLISGRYVLSGATCFSTHAIKIATPVSVRLGDYDVNNDGPDCVKTDTNEEDCTDGAISIPIEKFTTHPDYNINNSRQNDITLIRLLRMAPFTDFIRPICMPSLDIAIKAPQNLYMTVAGWGAVNATVSSSNVLRRVHVPYVDFYLCRHKYNVTSRITLTDGQLCAGSKNRDACWGDSGGPLMLLKGQTTEVAGIVSFGPNPCGKGIPGVYTKVFAYNAWVKMTIETDVQMSTTKAISTSVLTTTTTTTKNPTTIQDLDSDLIVFRD